MNQSLWESDRVRGAVSQSSHRPAMHRDKILIRYMYTVESLYSGHHWEGSFRQYRGVAYLGGF